MLWLAWRTWGAPPAERAAGPASRQGLAAAFGSTFALTLTSPVTILSFAAMFAAVGLDGRDGAVQLVLGIGLGSATWWVLLSTVASLFARQLDAGRLKWVNRASGLVLAGYGLLALLHGV